MRDLRVFFSNWWTGRFLPGNNTNNLYTYLLSKNYNVIIDSINPDVVFYDLPDYEASFNNVLNYKNSIKIFCTNEPNP